MKSWINNAVVGTSLFLAAMALIWILLSLTGMMKLYSIPTNAMAPFIRKGDQIIAERFSLQGGLPQRGDVVTFTTQGISSINMRGDPVIYIKRVVGLPGDRLEFKGDVLYINDLPVGECFDAKGITYLPLMSLAPGKSVTVPADHLFMMGDNSGNSSDSRYWGPLSVKNLRQRYWFHLKHGPPFEEEKQQP